MTELRAIPSRHIQALVPPPGAVEHAIAGLKALAVEDQAERLFGFLEPRAIRGIWDGHHRAVYVMLDGIRFWSTSWSGVRNIGLRWTTLSRTEDWYDDGWLPDEGWAGLADGWRDRIWRAIQPPEARRLAVP